MQSSSQGTVHWFWISEAAHDPRFSTSLMSSNNLSRTSVVWQISSLFTLQKPMQLVMTIIFQIICCCPHAIVTIWVLCLEYTVEYFTCRPLSDKCYTNSKICLFSYRCLGLCKQCRHQRAQKLGGETGCGPDPGQRRPPLPCGSGWDDQHHCQQIRSPAWAPLCHSEWESYLSGERFVM